MEHGLLNVDCLWVMDEVQLMDVGLATSVQLQGFASNDEREDKLPRPWLGAGIVSKWPRFRIQVGMGAALIVAASIFLATAQGLLPGGGDAEPRLRQPGDSREFAGRA